MISSLNKHQSHIKILLETYDAKILELQRVKMHNSQLLSLAGGSRYLVKIFVVEDVEVGSMTKA